MLRVCHAFLSVNCSLVGTCWKSANLLALLCVMFYCVACKAFDTQSASSSTASARLYTFGILAFFCGKLDIYPKDIISMGHGHE